MSDPILAPRCPGCNSLPAFTFLTPYFCPNDVDCRVITWDPYEAPEKFKATATTIDLGALEHIEDRSEGGGA